MFERFTDNSRTVVVKAQEEARLLRHNYIGTEHLLLGLFCVPTGIAANVLRKLGLTPDTVRAEVETIVGCGKEQPSGHIPFTPRAKKVMELSLREALRLNHNYIGTEHILLALEREGDGVAAKILANQLPSLDVVRTSTLALLSHHEQPDRSGAERAPRTNAADEVVITAEALAGDAPMGSHHLLEALVRAEGSMAAKVLKDLGVDPAAVATKVDEFDAEETTDASPEEVGARKMELRVEGDEVHLVFRDAGTVGLAKAVSELTGGPLTSAGPVTGKFVPLWTKTNEMLVAVLRLLRDEPDPDAEPGKAALLVRRVLRDRLRRRGRPNDEADS